MNDMLCLKFQLVFILHMLPDPTFFGEFCIAFLAKCLFPNYIFQKLNLVGMGVGLGGETWFIGKKVADRGKMKGINEDKWLEKK